MDKTDQSQEMLLTGHKHTEQGITGQYQIMYLIQGIITEEAGKSIQMTVPDKIQGLVIPETGTGLHLMKRETTGLRGATLIMIPVQDLTEEIYTGINLTGQTPAEIIISIIIGIITIDQIPTTETEVITTTEVITGATTGQEIITDPAPITAPGVLLHAIIPGTEAVELIVVATTGPAEATTGPEDPQVPQITEKGGIK